MDLKEAIQKAPNPMLLTRDEQQVIQAFRTAQTKEFADLKITIQFGRVSFFELIEKAKPLADGKM
jgi:hypothetical protein